MTEEELDALDIMADLQRLVDDEGDVLARASLQYITSLRAQVAAANARADRAEAERAAQPSPDVAAQFDSADWYWRTMDPDDCGDNPAEAINRGMVGLYCVCEIASSFTGPTRYGFLAPVLDPESDDEEFVHFGTQQEAMEAAKARAALARVKGGAA